MRRCARGVATIILSAISAFAQADAHPKLTLDLPAGVDSAKVEIRTFLTGGGGHGGFIRPEPQRTSYDIDPYVDGGAATRIRAIVFIPGCEITKIDVEFAGAPLRQALQCTPMPTVLFRGQMTLPGDFELKDGEVEASYEASWDHPFFGIADGFVSTFVLGRVAPNADGSFAIDIPDFYRQPDLRDAGIQFMLRQPKTGNILAILRPEGERAPFVSIRPAYPTMNFLVQRLPKAKPQ